MITIATPVEDLKGLVTNGRTDLWILRPLQLLGATEVAEESSQKRTKYRNASTRQARPSCEIVKVADKTYSVRLVQNIYVTYKTSKISYDGRASWAVAPAFLPFVRLFDYSSSTSVAPKCRRGRTI